MVHNNKQCIRFKRATLTHITLCSTQPALSLHSLLNYHTPTRCLYALQTPTCLLLVVALPLPPVVLMLQPPQSATHSHLKKGVGYITSCQGRPQFSG